MSETTKNDAAKPVNEAEMAGAQGKKPKKNRKGIAIVLGLLLLMGLGVGGYYYFDGLKYFVTDNAKVTAALYNVMPTSSGKLMKLKIKTGSYVSADEVIARLERGPYIKAPVDGKVVKCDVVQNQNVSPSQVIAVVADTGDIYIGANIEETDIRKIAVGQQVIATLDAYPGQKFKGYVEQIDEVTQSMLKGGAQSLTTSGTYTKVTQLFAVKIYLEDDVDLEGIIGTNVTVKIKIK